MTKLGQILWAGVALLLVSAILALWSMFAGVNLCWPMILFDVAGLVLIGVAFWLARRRKG